MTEKTRPFLVLDDFWEPRRPLVEENVVIPIVANGRDFYAYGVTQPVDLHAPLSPELMESTRWNAKAFTGAKRDRLAGGNPSPESIHLDVQRRACIGGSIVRRPIEENDHPAPAPIDDVFPLGQMAMQGRSLSFGFDQYLLGVWFGVVRPVRASVPQGKESAAECFKRLASEIGDIPAEHAIANLRGFRPGLPPSIRRPVREGGERKGEFFEDDFRGGDCPVDSRARKRRVALGRREGVFEAAHERYNGML